MIRDSLSNFISRPPQSSGRSAARIVDSSSRKAVSFPPLAQRNAFRRRNVRLQSRSFARVNPALRRSPNSNRLCVEFGLTARQDFSRAALIACSGFCLATSHAPRSCDLPGADGISHKCLSQLRQLVYTGSEFKPEWKFQASHGNKETR